MFKKIIMAALFLMAFGAQAEVCSAVIKDRFGSTLERYTETSYSHESACSEAMFKCNRSLSDARANGRYYDATCEVEGYYPPTPTRVTCESNLIDAYNRVLRTFTAMGSNEYEACGEAESMCRNELYRNPSWGLQCITRGRNPNPGPNPPPPPRVKTESCQASRFDPSGVFIQNYFSTETGPIYSDVRAIACQRAMSICQRDLKGRQFCNVTR
jgi:hypothetical protein